MTDLKRAILDHFGDDYTAFYEHFHPDLQANGGKATVLCSTHNDHVPNRDLELRGEKAGSHYCQVCQQGGHALDYYAIKKSLSCKSEFPRVLQGIVDDFGINVSNNGQVKQEIVATFDYTDEDGELLYQIVRKEPGKNGNTKDFVIRRPDGNGGWIYKKGGVRIVPYRLHDLMKTRGQGPVVIVEGEAHADALWALGIRATTNPFGAGKWNDSYSGCLKDEDIVLWPDLDLAGIQHMEKVATSVKEHAKSVRWVTPPSELGKKGDVRLTVSRS